MYKIKPSDFLLHEFEYSAVQIWGVGSQPSSSELRFLNCDQMS